jgi:hypothetical protein
MTDETEPTHPRLNRPTTGLLAWQFTIGYISAEYSPDATLTLRVQPDEAEAVMWDASVAWGQKKEFVEQQATLSDALRRLWREVKRNHRVFKSLDASVRQPADYGADEWLDEETQRSLDRLIELTSDALETDWHIIIIYQSVENPDLRVRARLLAKESTVHIGGRGPSIREACRDLYYNAAPEYFSSKQDENFPE